MLKFVFILFFALACQKNNESILKTLTLSTSSEMTTIDPANCYDTVCSQVVNHIYETLFEYEFLKRPYTLRPLLAETMPQVENKGTKYIFKIKKNIHYHPRAHLEPTRTVKAQDFITQIKRVAFTKTQSQGWWLFENRIKGLDDWRKKVQNLEDFDKFPVEGLQAPDDHTLIIELTKPYPQLLYALAMGFTVPIPQEALGKLNNILTQETLGTGPFTLQTYKPQQEIILRKNPKYITSTYPTTGDRYAFENNLLVDRNKPLPFLDEIKIIVMKEQQTSWLNFLAKKIDLIVLSKDYFQSALTSEGQLNPELDQQGIQLQVTPTLMYWWLAFNMNDPLLGKNLNLRKAIAHAVNVEKFIKIFTHNSGLKANSIYPPGVPGYNPSSELPFSYNPTIAAEYLAKAGYPSGKNLPEITFDVRGNNTLNRQIAEFIQQELGAIGIKIKMSLLPFPQFLEKSRKGELQFWHGGWVMDYPDAENTIQLLTSENFPPGPNSSFYKNVTVDEAFQKIRYLDETAEKYQLMSTIEEEVQKDLPWIMLYYSRSYVLHYQRVKNFRHSDIVNNYMKYIRLEDSKKIGI